LLEAMPGTPASVAILAAAEKLLVH